MFARIPEISSSLSSQSWSSRKDVKSPPPVKKLAFAEGTEEKTGLQPESTKSWTSGARSKTSELADPHRRPSSVTEELCLNSSYRGGPGFEPVKVTSRRVSSGNVGGVQTKSLNLSSHQQQQQHRSSLTSSTTLRMAESSGTPPTPPRLLPLESINKATSVVLCAEPVRRLSGGSFSKVSPEIVLEEGARRNSDSYQYRRKSSRDSSSRRRSSLVLTGSNYRVGRKIGSGNFGEIHLGYF